MKQLTEINSDYSKRLIEMSNLQKEMEKLLLQRSTWNLEFGRNDKVRLRQEWRRFVFSCLQNEFFSSIFDAISLMNIFCMHRPPLSPSIRLESYPIYGLKLHL